MSSIGDIQNTVFDPANAAIRTVGGGSATGGAAAGTSTSIQGGVYNTTPPTYTNGNATQNQSDVNGNQKVTLATSIAGEDIPNDVTKVEQRFGYTHISTATTTVVKTGVGFLHAISVNTLGTVASTTTIYDNTAASGNIIGVINTLTLSGLFVLDVSFSVGLTIVTTGTVAPDITVSSR